MQNCFFDDNVTGTNGGGAKVVQGADLTALSCTFRNNRGSNQGGGVYINGGSGTTLTARNCIFWGNNEDYPNNVLNQIHKISTPTVTVTTSDVQGGYTGTGNINSDPLFVFDSAYFLYIRISSSSPCIDAGNNTYVSWSYDFEGGARIQGGTTDMGVDEVQ